MKIDYHTHNWGPLLFRTKITVEDLKKVKALCKKDKKEDATKTLAGVINHEYLIDKKKYSPILQPYFQAFQNAYFKWYDKTLKKIKCTSAWVNYMKHMDCNPPHTHTRCDLSSVLYLKIPKTLKKENQDFKGDSQGPGAVSFMYGEDRDYNLSEWSLLPEERDLYIFPFNLKHSVASFKSKGERVSVAANFSIDEIY